MARRRAVKLPGMTEAVWQKAVIDLAQACGWTVAHFRPARAGGGEAAERWMTPVAAHGKGFPDLVLVRPPHLIFAELKTDTGRERAEQKMWLSLLSAVADDCNEATGEAGYVQVYVWRPRDVDEVARVLAR